MWLLFTKAEHFCSNTSWKSYTSHKLCFTVWKLASALNKKFKKYCDGRVRPKSLPSYDFHTVSCCSAISITNLHLFHVARAIWQSSQETRFRLESNSASQVCKWISFTRTEYSTNNKNHINHVHVYLFVVQFMCVTFQANYRGRKTGIIYWVVQTVLWCFSEL